MRLQIGSKDSARLIKPIRWIIRVWVLVTLAFCVGVSSLHAQQDTEQVWQRHFADHLPEYCKFTRALPDWRRSGRSEWTVGTRVKGLFSHPMSTGYYTNKFGAAWTHMHHYCLALELSYQASVLTKPELRNSRLREAIPQFLYVLDRADPGYVLRAEGLFNIGMTYMMLGQNLEAIEYLSNALVVDPQYVPSYVILADYFQRLGDLDEAVLVLRRGLASVPDSPILSEKLAELGFKSDAATD